MADDKIIEVRFTDGAVMSVHPRMKVMNITAPQGRACSLKSTEGRGYLATLCHDKDNAGKFREMLGREAWEAAGHERPPAPEEQPDHRPRVSVVHKVDVIV